MWWSRRPVIPAVALTVGIILLLLSLNANFKETRSIVIDGIEKEKEVPNYALALTGWFVTAFALLHFYPMAILECLRDKVLKRAHRNAIHIETDIS
jgi:hypothetical protein